jgi:hypothetical protein
MRFPVSTDCSPNGSSARPLLSDLGLFGVGSPVTASFETFLKKRVCLKLNEVSI